MSFLHAILPERVVVLRLPLCRYSVGHEILLRRINSPFLQPKLPGTEALLPHLFTNVYICSMPYAEAVDSIESPELELEFRAWRRRLGRRYDLHQAIASFAEYLRDGSTWPEFTRRKRKGFEFLRTGSSWPAVLLTALMAELHFSLEAALNCPLGLAQHLYCTHRELQGNIQIVSEAEIARRAVIRAEMQRMGLRPLKADECEFANPQECNFTVPAAAPPADPDHARN